MERMNLNIAIDFDGKELFIAENGSSGCTYLPQNKKELIEYVVGYVMDCTDEKYDFEMKIVGKGDENE